MSIFFLKIQVLFLIRQAEPQPQDNPKGVFLGLNDKESSYTEALGDW